MDRRNTLYLSQKQRTVKSLGMAWEWQAPYIYFDLDTNRWESDVWLFIDDEYVTAAAKYLGYDIK